MLPLLSQLLLFLLLPLLLLLSPLLLPQPPMGPLPCSQLLAAQGLAPGV
jgi:hypothetical protein